MMTADFHAFVRDVLEPDILPAYRIPYHDGEPRYIHGCIHVSRCVIFAEAMLTKYRSLGISMSRFDPTAIRVALGWHDAGRQGDGVDEWEEDSARLAVDFLQHRGFSPDYANYVGSLIAHERRPRGDFNAHIVQACDSLDILRVYPGRGFKRDLFHFLHPRHDPVIREADDGTRNRLILEAENWIEETDGFWFQRKADESPTCCQDLLRNLAQSRDRYPTLAALTNSGPPD